MSDTHAGSDGPIGDDIAEVIRWKARCLVGCAGFGPQDRPDLEQELTLRLLGPLRRYDPAKGTRLTFATRILGRLAANILRDWQRARRRSGPITSLDPQCEGGESEKTPRSVQGRTPRPDTELAELALDVASTLERLPEDLRALAAGLMSESLAALARRLGVPRSTLRDRLQAVRERLAQGNLDEY